MDGFFGCSGHDAGGVRRALFEPLSSQGQADRNLVQMTSEGHVLGFGESVLYVASADHALRVDFSGGRAVRPEVEGAPAAERKDSMAVPLSGRVIYPEVWDGVTVVYEKGAGIVKSTYQVQAGAVERIRLRYNRPVELAENGSLVTLYDTGQMVESQPVAWQEVDGGRRPVAVSYVVYGDREVGFRATGNDPSLAMVIDPDMTWNTFLGGEGADYGYGIAVDGSGNVYVAGYSNATWGSPVRAYTANYDAFAAKLGSDGSLAWNSFLGGDGYDIGYAIAVDGSGTVYVAGYSTVTWGSPVRSYSSNGDAFAAKLGSDGSLTWNTFLGSDGSDDGTAIAVDSAGKIYVGGYSDATWGSPVRGYTASVDAFAAKLGSDGSLTWNTFLGGSGEDYGYGIAVDGSGTVYVAGYSTVTWGSPVRSYSSNGDAFAAKLGSDGSLTWNTFLGGDGSDYGRAIAVDGSGNVYVAGNSTATWGSPVRPYTANYDAFAAKLGSDGSLTWHAFLGGDSADYGRAIAVDGSGNVYVAGYSYAAWGTPVRTYTSGYDAFAAKLSPSLATVTTQAVSNIGMTTATGNGNVMGLGAPHPTQHGVCWNTTGSPTIADSKTEEGAVSETGAFTSSMTGLSPNTTYYVRAYATNTDGTAYGEEVSFPTNAQAPTVTTQAVSDIGETTATGNGNITALGAPNPTQHGVCWNTTGSPTIAGSKTEEGAVSATGTFTSSMTGLSPDTTYYVRAYATNTAGTAYGNEVTFPTSAQAPTVTTQAVSNIDAATATGNGTVTSLGTPNPTQHGVCWNTTGSPTIAGSKTQDGAVSATGPFSSNMTGLSPSTMYFVRAYATNSAGTAYGSDVNFRTACSVIFYVSRDGDCEGNDPCYRTIQAAIDAANTGTCIRIEEGTYTELITLNAPKTVTLQGGWDTSFENQTPNTTFIKAPKAPQGELILQMLTIKP